MFIMYIVGMICSQILFIGEIKYQEYLSKLKLQPIKENLKTDNLSEKEIL